MHGTFFGLPPGGVKLGCACWVVLDGRGSACWRVLACAPYIGVVEITENFRGYFARVWVAVRWVRGGGADFGTLAKGCSRTFGLPLGSLRSKILEDFEENL